MPEQNFKNHSQVVWSYYIFTLLPTLALLAGSIINLVHSKEDNVYSASLIILVAVILVTIIFRARGFALKAQDRAIRAEESLRHFVLTGKPLDARLSIKQIVALRFASNEELPSLAQRAITENLGNKEIKMQIKHWRPDTYRV
ncbi:MAG TPA: DUF6526 family protein [Chitinophagaceae bacterium]|nr:DUF6526 family protein [Chitinophagaceae bacterium]